MTIRMDNWCQTCDEACHDHATICTVCGTSLGPPPPPAPNSRGTGSSSGPSTAAATALSEGFMDDLRDANRDLHAILGSLRGQVQDLDALTRGFIQQQQREQQGAAAGGGGSGHGNGGEWQTAPADWLNPAALAAASSSSHRPTAKNTLAQISHVVLDEKSTLFRQATLELPITPEYSSSETASPPTSPLGGGGRTQHLLKLTCIMGEFGPMGEFDFRGSPIVVCSPLTGKGGELSSSTTRLIRHLAQSDRTKVVAFLQRGDGVTFVQKAILAQEAGASAVVIGNNTSSAWPYVMKDSKNEATKLGLKIPVAMIQEEDSKKVLQLYKQYHHQKQQQQQLQEDNQTQDGPRYMHCNLHIEKSPAKDCVVCCEKMDVGDKVMQLPDCGHVFHSDCALAWLVSHNTCPYCRRELPTDDPEYEDERRRQQRTHAGSSTTASTMDPSAPTYAAQAFYG